MRCVPLTKRRESSVMHQSGQWSIGFITATEILVCEIPAVTRGLIRVSQRKEKT